MAELSKYLLKAIQCKALGEGQHADGGGLYLCVNAAAERYWVYRYSFCGKQFEMGLGSFSENSIGLAKARSLRDKWACVLASGQNPMDAKDMERRRQPSRGGR